MASPEIKSLLEQYLAGSLSEDDFKRLWETLKHPETDEEWLGAIEEAMLTKLGPSLSDHTRATEALAKIKARIAVEENEHSQRRPGVLWMMKYAAAILVLVVSAVALFYFNKENTTTQIETAQVITASQDVEPGSEKAVLTLADGSTIVLDNAASGKIAEQGHVQVIKLPNGEIQYKAVNADSNPGGAVSYNTMSTPRGGQYQLVLPDGSKAWLNAESSITYPIIFTGGERRVKISGEIFFEVAKDKSKPFRVETNDMEVEVLGTQFNVKAYADDGPTRTSLLEGSVKINTHVLKPGQAFMNGKVVATDIEQDVAWKNGIFNFNNQNLSQVMVQLARWYDLDVVYPSGVPQKEYGGEIGRNLKLGQVLKGLENSGVHFELNGKRIIVTAK